MKPCKKQTVISHGFLNLSISLTNSYYNRILLTWHAIHFSLSFYTENSPLATSLAYFVIKITLTNSVTTIRKGYYHFRILTQSSIMHSSVLQLLEKTACLSQFSAINLSFTKLSRFELKRNIPYIIKQFILIFSYTIQ